MPGVVAHCLHLRVVKMDSSIELPNRRSIEGNVDNSRRNNVLGIDTYTPPVGNNPNLETVDIASHEQMSSGLSKPQKKSGLGGASANLVNSIVGAGIIGIPYALKQSGLLAGLFLLALVSYLTGETDVVSCFPFWSRLFPEMIYATC